MSDKTELLPCPFCGAAADGDAHPHPVLRDYSLWRVACDNPDCMADVHGDTPEKAIAAWNRRVDARITVLETENVRLREALQVAAVDRAPMARVEAQAEFFEIAPTDGDSYIAISRLDGRRVRLVPVEEGDDG